MPISPNAYLPSASDIDVSVIIPCYNRADLLLRSINSVRDQQGAYSVQIIVVDDGSTDTTKTLLEPLITSNAITYIYQQNQGVSAARNTGLQNAKGVWIALLDSDDYWHADKLVNQLDLLQTSGLKVVHSAETWVDNGQLRNQKQHHQKFGGQIFTACLAQCAMSPSSIILHKSVFEDLGHFDVDLPVCEDYDMWLRVAAHYQVAYLDAPLVTKYAGHDNQLSRTFWGMDRFRIQSLEKNYQGLDILTINDRIALLTVLLKKMKIYGNGLRKRNKLEEWQIIDQKSQYYQSQLALQLEKLDSR